MRSWLAVLVVLCTMPLAAQVGVDGLHLSASGDLGFGYSGGYGNQIGASNHELDFTGSGGVSGYYYVPQFLSFNVSPYYNRSQNNSTSQGIFDSSGYSSSVTLFSGRSPLNISFSQSWNSQGLFGVPGAAGLVTKDNSRGFGIGWGISLPNLPSLSIGYSDGSGSSSVVGSDTTSSSVTRTFTLGSSYRVYGFSLRGGYIHTNTSNNLSGSLADGEAENGSSSSNSYSLSASHRLPFFSQHSTITGAFGRSTFTDNSGGEQTNGATDNASLSTYLPFHRLPVTLNANYTDDLYGSLEQQQISSGQALLPVNISPESHLLLVSASTLYRFRPNLGMNAYVEREQEYIAGQSFGSTQFGINANYNFLRRLKGLTVTAGVVDSASQVGNSGVSAVGNASYANSFHHWEYSAGAGYSQNVQTLGVVYTTSSLYYGGNVRRRFTRFHANWNIGANASHSGFGQVSGAGSSGEFIYSSLALWGRLILSGNDSKSSGTSVLTSSGQVALPLPIPLISANNLVVYNTSGHGGNVHWSVLRNLGVDAAYSKSEGTNLNTGVSTVSSSSEYYGLATYHFRKVSITAAATRFLQSISGAGNVPSSSTSYSFTVSRWFKAF